MTLETFDEEVCDFSDLKDWCSEHSCEYCDDVYDDYAKNDRINEDLVDWARECTWEELYSILDNIPTGYDWYTYNDYGEWSPADFDSYKSWCRDWGIENDEFYNPEYEDEDEDEDVDPYELEPTEEEEVSLDDMFSSDDIVLSEPDVQESDEYDGEDIFKIMEWAEELSEDLTEEYCLEG